MKPRKYTVLLLYPWEQGGEQVETFQAHVYALGRHSAILQARRDMIEAEPGMEGQTLEVVAVYGGHLKDIKPDYTIHD